MTVVPARVAGRRPGRRRLAGRPRRPDRTRSCSARPACSRSTRFVVAGGAQAIGALAYGLPGGRPRAGRPDRRTRQRLGHRGQDRGLRRGRHRPAGRPVRGDGPRRAAGRPGPRRRRPHHPGRARPGLAGHPRHDGRGLRRRGRGRGRRPARHAPRAATSSSAALRDHGRIVLAPTLDAAIDFVNAYAPEHLSVDVEPLEPTVARLRNAGSLFVGPWAPESAGDYATGANHVLPTGGLARGVGRRSSVEAYGKFIQVQRSTATGLAVDPRRPSRPWPRPRACSPIATPSRSASRTRSADEPDAGHLHLADRARRLQLGGDRRGGRGALRPRSRRRSSASTSTPPPPRRPSSTGSSRPAGSRRRCPSTRRPTTAGWSRRPRPATA